MSDFLLRIKSSEFLVIWGMSVVGVPLLMVVASVGVPALRNPLFLLSGALVAFFLMRRVWLSRLKDGRGG